MSDSHISINQSKLYYVVHLKPQKCFCEKQHGAHLKNTTENTNTKNNPE